jgi:hypothetical protein
MKRNILALGSAAGMAAVGLVAVAAAPASAATTNQDKANAFISATTGLHNAPSTQAPAAKTLDAGKAVWALCFVPNGEKVQGNTIWFRISADDNRGWVPRAAIGGVPALPQC